MQFTVNKQEILPSTGSNTPKNDAKIFLHLSPTYIGIQHQSLKQHIAKTFILLVTNPNQFQI